MEKYIHKVSGTIPNTYKTIDIDLNGRNLIITGGNGSGKTCLLNELHKKTDLLIRQKQQADLSSIQKEYNQQQNYLSTLQKGTSNYDGCNRHLEFLKQKLDNITQGLKVEILNNIDFSSKLDDRAAVIAFFEAHRKTEITSADTAKGIDSEKEKIKSQTNYHSLGNNLEQHLVNLRNRRSLAITEDQDQKLADKISNWFNFFEDDLKLLLEDETAKLNFESSTLKFTISQEDKPRYTFQSLSSGYQAIFQIYADLLMRTEYFDVTPKELVGAVLIDEVDAHLHVSLQRLILPFLTKSFPNVQFVVTTHSPFVLMSAEDTVIYDLSKNEQIDDDISLFSHTSIIEGLLDTKSSSQRLDQYINELAEIVNSKDINYARLEVLLDKLRGGFNTLDSKSKSFFMLGENALLDKEQ
ncbi:TPA: AAA family ATPase [Photobacterium damselae]